MKVAMFLTNNRGLQESEGIHEEAHKFSMAAITWVYPRGAAIKKHTAPEIVACAPRRSVIEDRSLEEAIQA